MAGKVIEVKGLVKSYKDLIAVDNLDLDLYKGEILGLLGPNGSGKSTTISCILSLLSKDRGSIKIFGEEMRPDSYDIKRRIGVVFQDVGVYEELSVYENIDYFCGLYIRDKEKRKTYIQETVDLVGLGDFLKFKPRKLSGGLLRRLNIACGIAHKPELIIFDEPTVAVDPQSRNNILDGIRKLNKYGASIIYTSHYMDEIESLCDYIVILDKGKVIAKGDSDSLKDMIDLCEKISFETENLPDEALESIRAIDSLIDLSVLGTTYKLSFSKSRDNITRLVEILRTYDIDYDHLSSSRPSLNDVFLQLTGKELRD